MGDKIAKLYYHIDYQVKEVKRYQKAEANEPIDAFELIAQNFPIIGFAKTEQLRKEFEITVKSQKEDKGGDFVALDLKVKPDSVNKDDYTSIEFRIDDKMYLPVKIIAVSTEDDIYQISFLEPIVNKKIDEKVFEVEIPKGFGEPEIVPLKKRAAQTNKF